MIHLLVLGVVTVAGDLFHDFLFLSVTVAGTGQAKEGGD